jgi:hypothetical protein
MIDGREIDPGALPVKDVISSGAEEGARRMIGLADGLPAS